MRDRICEAVRFAVDYYEKAGVGYENNYFYPPLEMLSVLNSMNMAEINPDLMITGILFNTVEDTGVTIDLIAERFGEDVAALVNQLAASEEDSDRLWFATSQVDHYYDRLEMIPGADTMLRTFMEEYGDRCEILTGIPKPWRNVKNAGEDKEIWMRRYFGSQIKVNIVYRQEKKNYCHGKDYILIDDFQENIDDWISYGGTGILFKDAESAMKEMQNLGIL